MSEPAPLPKQPSWIASLRLPLACWIGLAILARVVRRAMFHSFSAAAQIEMRAIQKIGERREHI